MQEKENHFIKNIEIKNFKCFEDFKAEGFGRVNLIGGKNNVGKTAFMEACLLGSVKKDTKEYIRFSLIIELHRNSLNFLLDWLYDFTLFEFKYIKSHISINSRFIPVNVKIGALGHNKNNAKILMYNEDAKEVLKNNYVEECEYSENMVFDKNYENFNKNKSIDFLAEFYKEGMPPLISNTSFISVGNNFNNYLVNFIDEIKLSDKEDKLNQVLKSFFDIEKIDIIKNKVMLKKESKYLLLSEFGDGVKHFLNIILALYLNKDSILYLDEIENGIHYTNLDKLWEIILTISKQQNVQVFATTHSKECIESYARVAKKLEDKEITFIKMTQLKDGKIMAGVRDYDMLQYTIKDGHEVRGV